MYNVNLQYRCTIIRGKAQKELDDLLPMYAEKISELCPCEVKEFTEAFRNSLSNAIYKTSFGLLEKAHQKTISNHDTEIAHKLFGLYYSDGEYIYESPSCTKLLHDNDQPAFFKNLCLNFQFPNATQKIQTIADRLQNKIRFKPFHFILDLLFIAQEHEVTLTWEEIGFYALNALEVLQGKVTSSTVLQKILEDRKNKIVKSLPKGSRHMQHIREQFNLLKLANLINLDGNNVSLNKAENPIIKTFRRALTEPLAFDISQSDLQSINSRKKMYLNWAYYFGQIASIDINLLQTSIEALQGVTKTQEYTGTSEKKRNGTNHTILGDEGEIYVLELEKQRVKATHPKLLNKILLLGKQRGLGYDVASVEAEENYEEPEFARFIEVKATKRTTEPDLLDKTWNDSINLTRKEWIAAKQYRSSYNIYRVYFTPHRTIVTKINDPFTKYENKKLKVIPTTYRMEISSQIIDGQY